jgi:hypothetical protein
MTNSSSKPIKSGLGLVHTASLLELLYLRAAPHLSRADLCRIAVDSAAYAESVASNAAEVAEGIGALIAVDSDDAGNLRSGAFQEISDLPGLLWHFAEVFRSVQGAAHVASRAASTLNAGGAA